MSLIIQSIHIFRDYGDPKKFQGSIEVVGERATTKLLLDNELVQMLMPQIAEAIRQQAAQTARLLESETMTLAASTVSLLPSESTDA